MFTIGNQGSRITEKVADKKQMINTVFLHRYEEK